MRFLPRSSAGPARTPARSDRGAGLTRPFLSPLRADAPALLGHGSRAIGVEPRALTGRRTRSRSRYPPVHMCTPRIPAGSADHAHASAGLVSRRALQEGVLVGPESTGDRVVPGRASARVVDRPPGRSCASWCAGTSAQDTIPDGLNPRVVGYTRPRGGVSDLVGRRVLSSGSTVPELDSPLLTLDGCDPSRLSVVRGWLRDQLHGADQRVGIDAELVVTELVANAHDHGGGADTVRIYVHRRPVQVRVEVDDGLPQAPLTVGRSRLGGFRGRGLVIIESVASWGVVRRVRDKTVWATVGPVAQVSGAPQSP